MLNQSNIDKNNIVFLLKSFREQDTCFFKKTVSKRVFYLQ